VAVRIDDNQQALSEAGDGDFAGQNELQAVIGKRATDIS
jgi:hypothetical protein